MSAQRLFVCLVASIAQHQAASEDKPREVVDPLVLFSDVVFDRDPRVRESIRWVTDTEARVAVVPELEVVKPATA